MKINAKQWTEEKIFFYSPDYFTALLSQLASAQHSILIEMYIFSPLESPGKEVVELLKAKAKAGLRVQVLVDGLGSMEWIQQLQQQLCPSGVRLRIYHPALWQLAQDYYRPRSWFKAVWETFQKFNSRNHKKVILIDGVKLFMGSYNFSPNHLPPPQGQGWSDLGLYLSGEILPLVEYLFESAWVKNQWLSKTRHFFFNRRLPFFHESILRYNPTIRTRHLFNRDLLLRLREAKTSITIVTPYFNPPPLLLRSLVHALKRGVRVRIISSSQSDVLPYHYLPFLLTRELRKWPAEIHYYKPHILHAKLLSIDDWTVVGSTNFNYRSYFHDLEVDAVITHPDNRRALQDYCQELVEQSDSQLADQDIGWVKALLGKIFFWLRYWL